MHSKTYFRVKKLIENGDYVKDDVLDMLDVFRMANRITSEEYTELTEMMK